MTTPAGALSRRILRTGVSLVPWALALYLHYWFEQDAIWEVDMAFRTLISGILIALGMLGSFLLHSRLSKVDR